RGPADHPEPPQRDQTGLLSEAFLSAAAQDRKLLLSYQGLAAHRHPLRQTCSKFSCRRDPHRRTLLDQVVSPDPSLIRGYADSRVTSDIPKIGRLPVKPARGGAKEDAATLARVQITASR